MNSARIEQRIVKPPTGFAPAIARWIWTLEDTRARTKQSLAGLNDETLNWLSPDKGHNIGSLLYHLVAIELAYLYEDILEIGWTEELAPLLIYDVRKSDGNLSVVLDEELDTHWKRLNAGRDLLLKALRSMAVADFHRIRRVEDYETTPEWVLHHLMQHEAEHRAQMSELRIQAETALGQRS